MSNPRLKFDPEGLDPRVERALDELIAPLQTWFDRGQLDFTSAGSFVQPRCHYFLTSDQALSNATDTLITWPGDGQDFVWVDTTYPATQFDNGAAFGGQFLPASGTLLVPPVAGQYLVVATVIFASNATGRRALWLTVRTNKNTSTVDYFGPQVDAVADNSTILQQSQIVTFVQGRTVGVRVNVYQNSGGSLNLTSGGVGFTSVSMIKLS